MGVDSGIQMEFPGKFLMDPGWEIWKEVWSENSDGPRLGNLEEFLVEFFE